MKQYARLLVSAMIVLSTAQGVARADTRIGFSSDREGTRDVWKTRDDGSYPIQVSDESYAVRNPTIAPGGKWVIYDVNGSTLYMNDFADPVGTPIELTTGYDANAGPYINTHRDFRVLYTLGVSGHTEVYMITIDGSTHEIIGDPISLTPDYEIDQLQPAFCGPSHFVFARQDQFAHEICYQGFNGSGATGSPTCWFGGYTDYLDDAHPACDSTGTYIAWARESESYSGTYDIWKMNADGSGTPQAITTHATDETMPVWAPGDTQIAFAWNYSNTDSSTDYEIWKMNADGSGKTPVTDNEYEDDAPTWGAAILP